MSMEFVVGIVLGLVASCLILLGLSIRKKRRAAKHSAEEPLLKQPEATGLASMQVGDYIDIGMVNYTVRGKLELSEGGYHWTEFWLDGRSIKVWLSVEVENGDVVVEQWTDIPDHGYNPDGKSLVYRGVQYQRKERGEATYRATGMTDLPDVGTLSYIDYQDAKGNLLSFERFDGGEWEAAEGLLLTQDMYSFYKRDMRPQDR
jgi:hypothetical protein